MAQAVPKATIKAYFINLDQDEAHRVTIENQLSVAGMQAQRVRALTPADPGLAAVIADVDVVYQDPRQLACLASHLQALQSFVCDSVQPDLALILEDDARLAPCFTQELLARVLACAPVDFECLQLGTNAASQAGFLLNQLQGMGLLWHRWQMSMHGAFAYLVSRPAATRIVDRLLAPQGINLSGLYMPCFCVADVLIFDLVRTYTCTFPLVGHPSTATRILPRLAPEELNNRQRLHGVLQRAWRQDLNELLVKAPRTDP